MPKPLRSVEATCSERSFSLLCEHYPNWREAREELNALRLAAEDWAPGWWGEGQCCKPEIASLRSR